MCGVTGIFHYGRDDAVDERVLLAMREAMVHRGPDDAGAHVAGVIGLGVRRLSIIDPAGGHQPMAGEDGSIVVTQNGEIYNFPELRKELRRLGHAFRTTCDTEVVVHAYEEWGVHALERLNGMFGLAIWDARRRLLVLARDPFGIKPLYLWDDGTRLLFASEVRSLLAHPLVHAEVDPEAISEYLRFGYVPSPRTALRSVTKLLPGHALVVGRDRPQSLHRFHRPAGEQLADDPSEIVEELRRLIRGAVERQLRADVPVGVMLSGGVDSTAIAALVAERDEPIKTFTVGFGDGFWLNELETARETARRLGAEHQEIVISRSEFTSLLPRVVRHLEEPLANPSAVPMLAVSELAARSVKVVLTGQGADEPFGGYHRYVGERYGHLYRAAPRSLRSCFRASVRALPRNERLKRAVQAVAVADDSERFRNIRSIVEPGVHRALMTHARCESTASDSFSRWEEDVSARRPLDRMLYIDARTCLADDLLLFGDKMSMATSLEARVPYLDLELMAFAERIPGTVKVDVRGRKLLLRRAVSAWTPKELLARDKIGFATPVDEWLRDGLDGDIRERLLEPELWSDLGVRPDVVGRLTDEHVSGRHDHKRVLFALLVLAHWHEEMVGPRPSGSRAP